MNGTCYGSSIVPKCTGNGHVQLYYGAPEYAPPYSRLWVYYHVEIVITALTATW